MTIVCRRRFLRRPRRSKSAEKSYNLILASMLATLRRLIFGEKRDVTDPEVFHHVSLAVFLAWVGLGADGLSSSAYGPDEAFRALGPHTHLAILLVLMTTVTIFVISIA